MYLESRDFLDSMDEISIDADCKTCLDLILEGHTKTKRSFGWKINVRESKGLAG